MSTKRSKFSANLKLSKMKHKLRGAKTDTYEGEAPKKKGKAILLKEGQEPKNLIRTKGEMKVPSAKIPKTEMPKTKTDEFLKKLKELDKKKK